MDQDLRERVRDRAAGRCEYCLIHGEDERYFRHHVEHILPRQHGGPSTFDNLALACHHCNLHKGPNLTGIDPTTNAVVALFNPRVDNWTSHFARHGVMIVGLTPVGRATVRVLAMNAPKRMELRTIAPQ